MFKLNLKNFKPLSGRRKRLFLFYGIANFLITNSVLHLLLLVIPIFLATIISQITNLIIGFYLYGKKVFKMNNLTQKELKKYILLASFLWAMNFVSIRFMYANGIHKNLAAIFTIPLLVLISYTFQKKYIFVKKELVVKNKFGSKNPPALRPDSNQILKIRMLVDWSSIEIFSEEGVFSLSHHVAFNPKDDSLSLSTKGGSVKLLSLELNQINSIWKH